MPSKTKIIMHAYVDENNYNAQNLNAKEISLRLPPEKYEISLFYKGKPDPRLLEKSNINLFKIPQIKYLASSCVLYKLMSGHDIFFYVNGRKTSKRYLKLNKSLKNKKLIYHYTESRLSDYNKNEIETSLNLSDFKYSVSKIVAEDIKKHFGVNTKVIYAGVDTKTFNPGINENIDEQNILFVGTLTERKRPNIILKLAKYFPKVKFHIIGTGPLKENIINESSKMKNVFLHNNVPIEKLVEFMQKADVFILPSLSEGLGKVTIEAQATGTPTIIFDNYGAETIINGKTGFAVSNFEEMIDKTKLLLENDGLRIKMGKTAIKFSKKFDWDYIVSQWDEEFDITAEISKV